MISVVSTVYSRTRFVHMTHSMWAIHVHYRRPHMLYKAMEMAVGRAVADHTLDSGGRTGDVSPTIASITNVPSTGVLYPPPPP